VADASAYGAVGGELTAGDEGRGGWAAHARPLRRQARACPLPGRSRRGQPGLGGSSASAVQAVADGEPCILGLRGAPLLGRRPDHRLCFPWTRHHRRRALLAIARLRAGCDRHCWSRRCLHRVQRMAECFGSGELGLRVGDAGRATIRSRAVAAAAMDHSTPRRLRVGPAAPPHRSAGGRDESPAAVEHFFPVGGPRHGHPDWTVYRRGNRVDRRRACGRAPDHRSRGDGLQRRTRRRIADPIGAGLARLLANTRRRGAPAVDRLEGL
jgi:hypothetical protein